MTKIAFDLALPAQHVRWGDYVAAIMAADRMDFQTFWTWDHLFPIFGNPDGSEFECYTTLAAFAQATKHIRIGALVSGVAYRNPAMMLKEVTQIDVISDGRFDFGIGAGWAEREFRAFNIPFRSAKDRIGELRETLALALQLWSGDPTKKVTFDGTYVKAYELFLNPQPVQRPHPPILVGGGGEQLTLRVVAHYADIWHGFGDLATLKHKIELIAHYAGNYGRSGADIQKSTTVSIWVGDLTDAMLDRLSQSLGRSPAQIRSSMIHGDPVAVERQLQPYIDVGITRFVVNALGLPFVDNWQRISDDLIPRFQTH